MATKLKSVVLCFTVLIVFTSSEVSFVTKCKKADIECQRSSAQAAMSTFIPGIPELGVKTLDPLKIEKIDASINGLKFIVSDSIVTGLQQCKVKRMDRVESKLFVKAQCDLTLDGNYVLNGRLLVLPIEGDGKIHVFLRKVVLSVDCDMGEKDGKDGKKHWTVKKYTTTFELKDKADVVFGNLFNGNELLGRAARELITTNSNDVVYELGPKVITGAVGMVISVINKFFHNVAIEDLTLDN